MFQNQMQQYSQDTYMNNNVQTYDQSQPTQKYMVKSVKEIDKKILDTVNDIANVVGSTMGPLANNVLISNKNHSYVTKDGISVLKAYHSDDIIENAVANLMRDASLKTNNSAGDGTSGTCILASKIIKEWYKYVDETDDKKDKNPYKSKINREMRYGMELASEMAQDYIRKSAIPVETIDDIRSVAFISSNGSNDIADVLANSFKAIGKNGVIKIVKGNSTRIENYVVDGMQFEQGYISPYFSTNDSMEVNLENPYIMILDKTISNINDILPSINGILNDKASQGRPILIIAHDVEGDALNTIVLNKLRGLPICAVKAPAFGETRTAMLGDIAVLTGGKVISTETGVQIESAIPNNGVLGTARTVNVTKDTTTIIGGAGTGSDEVKTRISKIQETIKNERNPNMVKFLESRIANLDGGIAMIAVGANTETELKEKQDLLDDAYHACKCAINGGIVAGGGVALLNLANHIYTDVIDIHGDDRFGTEPWVRKNRLKGVDMFVASLREPFNRIVKNAELDGTTLLNNFWDMLANIKIDECEDIGKAEQNNEEYVPANKDLNIGIDVVSQKIGNMITDFHIFDPAQVIIEEIKNAVSIAGAILSISSGVFIEE